MLNQDMDLDLEVGAEEDDKYLLSNPALSLDPLRPGLALPPPQRWLHPRSGATSCPG